MDPDEPQEAAEPHDRQCRAYGCRIRVDRSRMFCDRHWKFLDMGERRALCDAFGTETWRQELHKARRRIRLRDPEVD